MPLPLLPTEPSCFGSFMWLFLVLLTSAVGWIPVLVVYIIEHMIDPMDAVVPFIIVWALTLLLVLSVSSAFSAARPKLFTALSFYVSVAYVVRQLFLETHYQKYQPQTITDYTMNYLVPECSVDVACMFLGLILVLISQGVQSGVDLLLSGMFAGVTLGSFCALSISLVDMIEPGFDVDTGFILITTGVCFVNMTLYGAIGAIMSVFLVYLKTGMSSKWISMSACSLIIPFGILLIYSVVMKLKEDNENDDMWSLLPIPVYTGIIVSAITIVGSIFKKKESYVKLDETSK